MMKYLKFGFRLPIFLCLLYLASLPVYGQDSILVKGQFVNNTKFAKVIMKKYGVGTFAVGGATIKNGYFSISLPPEIPIGVYRFQYAVAEAEQYIDIIINGKEKLIDFTILANDPLAYPQFVSSQENKNWYDYLKESSKQMERINLLNQFIHAYPQANAEVVKAAIKEWELEKALYFEQFTAFKNLMRGTLAYEMVANRPYYFADPKDEPRIQDFEKREHFWDGFDANNPALINTPLYTDHILNYLRYWMNPNMNFSAEEKTNGFKRSVDVIIRKFSGNKETHAFAFKYLSLGFKEIGEEEVLQYLDQQYKDLAEQCFDTFEKTEFEKRMIGYAAMKIGNKAPDFSLNLIEQTQSNKTKKKATLHQVKSAKTLLVFWSSNCPHCLEELPKINEWAAAHKEITVLAISIDTNKEIHDASIKKFPHLWHSCDYKGWNADAVLKYYIAATPSFILLDSNKVILGKYSNWDSVPDK